MTRQPPHLSWHRRVALYSHDTQGLGHTRRNLCIAGALVEAQPATEVIVLTGAPEATVLPLPPSTEVLTLPTLRKHPDGRYAPRVLSGPLEDVLRVRAHLIDSALASFDPDLLIVDKVPRGVHGELDLALATMRQLGRAHMVLGLRDVLDVPAVAAREWEQHRTTEAVRDYYDQVWVYGDPTVYDLVREYSLPEAVAAKTVFTGYLAGPRPSCLRTRYRVAGTVPAPPPSPYVLCLVGGGEDGFALTQAFLHAPLPHGHHGVVLSGPYMPAGQRAAVLEQVERRDDLTLHEFTAETSSLVSGASAAVTMGGYNSLCELLSARCPTLVVPRVTPRLEQAVRAERLARAGWVDVVSPGGATPARIGEWLSYAVQDHRVARHPIDLDGLARIPQLVTRMLRSPLPAEVRHVPV